MKSLKRIFCFLLMLTFCWSFSACSKGKETSPSNSDGDNTPQIEQPESGGGEEQGGGEEPEVYTRLEMNDVFDIASRMCAGFVYNFESDTSDGNLFDDNVVGKQKYFIESSEMLSTLTEFENISCETTYKGELLSDVEVNTPNWVSKFNLLYWEEDEYGYSKADVKVLIYYKDVSEVYTYDYYNFVIEANNKQNNMSIKIMVEESVETGSYNSRADFVILELVGETRNPSNVISFDVIGFERNKHLENYNSSYVNNSNIINFTRSTFDGSVETYMSKNEGEEYLRTPNSEPHNMLVSNFDYMWQQLSLLKVTPTFRSISGLSGALISCLRA